MADTVAAPIEQAVNGVEGMLYMSSQMGNDGTYTLTVTFDVGVDLKTALVMVQNRVTQAMPQLPSQVQNQGITIRKKTPDILMIVNFYSPNGRYDDLYLSNYATINVKDELLRVPGVSDVTYQGERDYSIRCWLDPQKLAASKMTAMDVANAIRARTWTPRPARSDSRRPPDARAFDCRSTRWAGSTSRSSSTTSSSRSARAAAACEASTRRPPSPTAAARRLAPCRAAARRAAVRRPTARRAATHQRPVPHPAPHPLLHPLPRPPARPPAPRAVR